MEIRALTWNLFHGRDFPPDPSLFTWRSRLLRTTERNATHIQVNRDLLPEFTAVLREAPWDVAFLQECPPRWSGPLAVACDAESHRSLTSRNWLLPLTSAIARHNPDLIASWEGGSNLILVRGPLPDTAIAERRDLTLRHLPERRTMAFARLGAGLCVANLHASGPPELAAEDVLSAAEAALGWAGDAPLLFGGDLNLRPQSTRAFAELEDRFGLRAPTAPDAIDHLLVTGLEIERSSEAWPPEARELPREGLALRLSDHAPVTATFRTPS